MANTTNFNWSTPDDTALVKDGASAIRTLGSAIDSTLVDLKGGTTGQVLSKASGTDMDFAWVAPDPLTILDAKGDLITATAADTPSRLAVGTNGQVLTADSTASNGIKWANSVGAYTLLSSTTFSSSVSSMTVSGISGGYRNLNVEIIGPSISGGTNSELRMYVGSSSNSIATSFVNWADNSASTGSASKNFIALTGFNSSGTAQAIAQSNLDSYWNVTIDGYDTLDRKSFNYSGAYTTSSGGTRSVVFGGGGVHYSGVSPSAVSAITIETTSGTFSGSGTINIYGVK